MTIENTPTTRIASSEGPIVKNFDKTRSLKELDAIARSVCAEVGTIIGFNLSDYDCSIQATSHPAPFATTNNAPENKTIEHSGKSISFIIGEEADYPAVKAQIDELISRVA